MAVPARIADLRLIDCLHAARFNRAIDNVQIRFLAITQCAGRRADDALEGAAEGAFRLIADRECNGGDWFVAVPQHLDRQAHAPVQKVFEGAGTDEFLEPEGKLRPGHADSLPKIRNGPTPGDI